MSCLLSDDQNTGASASTSVLPVNIQGWSPLWLTGLISLLSKRLSGVFSSTTVEGISYLAFYLRKTIALTIQTFVGRVMFLVFNTQPSLLLLLSHFSRVWLCATPQMAAHQAPPSLWFSRQEHWSGLPFPSQCMKVKSESEVAQSCPTFSDPLDCSLPGSSVHGIFQARKMALEWGAIAFSQPSLEWSKNASIYWVSGHTSCPEGHMKLFLLSSEMSGPWRSQTETISCYFGSLVNADTPSQNWGRVKEWGKGSFYIDLPLHAASCHYHVPNTTLSKLDQNSVFSSYTF